MSDWSSHEKADDLWGRRNRPEAKREILAALIEAQERMRERAAEISEVEAGDWREAFARQIRALEVE